MPQDDLLKEMKKMKVGTVGVGDEEIPICAAPVIDYQCELRKIPEERRSHLHRGRNLKSHDTIFATDKRFGLVDIGHKGLEGSAAVGRLR